MELRVQHLAPPPRSFKVTYKSFSMTSKAKFKSNAFEAIYSAAQGLHRAGTIDKATMRDF